MKTAAVIFLVLISVKSFSQNDLKKTNQMKKVSLTNEGTIKVQAHNKGQYVSSDNKKIIEAKTKALSRDNSKRLRNSSDKALITDIPIVTKRYVISSVCKGSVR